MDTTTTAAPQAHSDTEAIASTSCTSAPITLTQREIALIYNYRQADVAARDKVQQLLAKQSLAD